MCFISKIYSTGIRGAKADRMNFRIDAQMQVVKFKKLFYFTSAMEILSLCEYETLKNSFKKYMHTLCTKILLSGNVLACKSEV